MRSFHCPKAKFSEKVTYKSLTDVNSYMTGLLAANFFREDLTGDADLEPDIYPRNKRPDPEMIPN